MRPSFSSNNVPLLNDTYRVNLKSTDLFHYTRKTFGEGTAWQEALARRKEAYTPAKRREKR